MRAGNRAQQLCESGGARPCQIRRSVRLPAAASRIDRSPHNPRPRTTARDVPDRRLWGGLAPAGERDKLSPEARPRDQVRGPK
jgi:hypothetical protein